jgi:hypothetical protein
MSGNTGPKATKTLRTASLSYCDSRGCRLQYRASCGQRRDIAERHPLLDSDTQAVKDAIALTDGDPRSCRDPQGTAELSASAARGW